MNLGAWIYAPRSRRIRDFLELQASPETVAAAVDESLNRG
jgi:hypothetical protein